MTSTVLALKNSTIPKTNNKNLVLADKDILNETFQNRKYKKTPVTQPKTICNSSISKLSDRVSKYLNDKVTSEDFYRTLLKNDIDPDSKQVNKILKELEIESNTSHKQTVSNFLKAKDFTDDTLEKLDKKLICSPVKQTMTSVEGEKYNGVKSLPNCNKRRFSEKSQLNSTENIFSTANKQNACNKDNSICSMNSSKSKKLEFMSNSSVFSTASKPLDNTNLSSKYSGSVLANFSSKASLGHGRYDNIKSQEPKSKSGIKYKNVLSEQNIASSRHRVKPEDLNIKIVGLHGKTKNNNTVSEVNQLKQSYNLIEWKVKKQTSSSKETSNRGLSIKANQKSRESISSLKTNCTSGSIQKETRNVTIVSTTPVGNFNKLRNNQIASKPQSNTPKTTVNRTFLNLVKSK